MGIKKILLSKINGRVNAPSSKSIMQRAVVLSMLAEGESIIKNPSYSDDGVVAINLIKKLGVKVNVKKNDESLFLYSSSILKRNEDLSVSCGESGLLIRMISPVLALFDNKFIVSGRGSLLKRPLDMIENNLIATGARCNSNKGYAPLEIQGLIRGGNITVDGSISSQFISGLLIALPLCKEDSVLKIENMTSKPYIELTLKMIRDAGIVIEEDKTEQTFRIKGQQKYKPLNVDVEGDWSGASFLLTAGAIAGSVRVNNLNLNSMQADKAILEVLELAGADVKKTINYVDVKKKQLNPFEFDISECPDLFPPIVALAVFCEGKSTVYGTERLKYKESSRADVLKKELGKLGIKLVLFDNKVEVYGGTPVVSCRTSANNDHRVAMALALIGLRLENGIEIEEWESVSKSYKNFFNDLQGLGGNVK